MAIQRVQDFYTQKARFYQRFFVGFLHWESVLETFFRANQTLHAGMKILDAGCGSGPVTKVLYRLARARDLADIAFHGFDLTPAMLDLFHQWVEDEGAQNIQTRQADVLALESQLPPDWKGYDLIVSSAMLEYIPEANRHQALVSLKSLLHEDGRLLLFVTQCTWLTRLAAGMWWRTHLFDRDRLEADLFQAGFKTVQFKRLPAGWDTFMLACESQYRGDIQDLPGRRNAEQ